MPMIHRQDEIKQPEMPCTANFNFHFANITILAAQVFFGFYKLAIGGLIANLQKSS